MDYQQYFENALIAGRDIVDVQPGTTIAVLHALADAAVARTEHLLFEKWRNDFIRRFRRTKKRKLRYRNPINFKNSDNKMVF